MCLNKPEVEVIFIVAALNTGESDVCRNGRIVCLCTVLYEEPSKKIYEKKKKKSQFSSIKKNNSQEKLLLSLLSLDAMGCGEPNHYNLKKLK